MADAHRYQLAVDAAERYERDIVPTLIRGQAELLLDHVPLYPGERVLDAACGTGIVSRVAMERFDTVQSIVGLDLNPAMLDVARATTLETNIPVEWRQGDLCKLPLPDHSFDVVLCQHGLQFMQDKLTALREIKRILVSSGRLAFTVWSVPNLPHTALAGALRRHVCEESATSCLSPFEWRDSDTIQKLVDHAGYREIVMTIMVGKMVMSASAKSVSEFIEFIAARSPFANEIQKVFGVIEQEVTETLQQYYDGKNYVMPTSTHLIRARVA